MAENGNVDNEGETVTTAVVRGEKKPNFRDVAIVTALIIPFNIAYNQCPTTFMVQGAVMKPYLGFIEAPSLDILDSVSVLVAGFFVSSYMYPFLALNIRVTSLHWGVQLERWQFYGLCL